MLIQQNRMHILHLISSPRGGNSISIKLGKGIVDKLRVANPEATLQVRNLATHPFPHLEEGHLAAFNAPAEQDSPERQAAVHHSDEAIREVMTADVIVIGVPLYNFGIPSSLKAWIDHIARARITFRYAEKGPEGLVRGKKVYLATASGGIYSEGPAAPMDFAVPYLKATLGFMGMTDVTVVRAEGTVIPGIMDTALEKGLASVSV